jgi:dihydrofolate reductase
MRKLKFRFKFPSVSRWENTTLAKGDIVDEVNKLKRKDGIGMIVYGGANFLSSLIKKISWLNTIKLFNPETNNNYLFI